MANEKQSPFIIDLQNELLLKPKLLFIMFVNKILVRKVNWEKSAVFTLF